MADYKQFKNKSVLDALTTGNVSLGSVANVRITGGSSGQFISTDGAGNLSFATPASAGTITATATGSLSDGTKVIVNSDGTVSSISDTTESLTQFTPSVASNSNNMLSAYDPTTGKILLAIINSSTSPIWYIGTITSGSLTLDYGYSLSATNLSYSGKLIYITENKFLFYYTDSSGYLKANVMTISGTTVSAGTAMTLVSVATQNLSAAYDTVRQRIAMTYTKSNVPYVMIGTLSGTTVTWGGEATIIGASAISVGRVVYNIATKTMVYLWTQGSTPQYGLSTSIPMPTSTNTAYTWQSVTNPLYTTWFYTESGTYAITESFQVSYNVAAKKIVILCYQKNSVGAWIVHGDGKNWSNPLHIPSTLSGNNNTPYMTMSYCYTTTRTTILFSDTGYNGFYAFSLLFDPVNSDTITVGTVNYRGVVPYFATIASANNGQTLVLYGNGTVSAYMWQLPTTTLTNTNYIGISNGSYTNGQTATIQTAGSVDDAQTGLTPGSAYYVQNNGSLSTTPGIPNVFAGTAIASTKLLIKG
jgi:hypothetical protein